MNTRFRNSIIAVALIGSGVVAGTAAAQSEDAPVERGYVAVERADNGSVAADSLAVSGVPSLFVPISPYRAFDSRDVSDGRLFSLSGPDGIARALFVLDDEDGATAIPPEATAITYNVTVVNQSARGFLTVSGITETPSDALRSSTINWPGEGGPIANGSAVALGEFQGAPGWIGVQVGGSSAASTDYLIDVTGYYVAPAI